MLSRVAIMTHGHTVVAVGGNPSLWADGSQARVTFPDGDGKIVSSTIRIIDDESDIQTIQWGDFGIVVFQKEA